MVPRYEIRTQQRTFRTLPLKLAGRRPLFENCLSTSLCLNSHFSQKRREVGHPSFISFGGPVGPWTLRAGCGWGTRFAKGVEGRESGSICLRLLREP